LNKFNAFLRSCYLRMQGLPGHDDLGKFTYQIIAWLFVTGLKLKLFRSGARLEFNLKGGMARADILPGFSDIDLQLIFEGVSSRRLIDSVIQWRKLWPFRVLPLLGELELVPASVHRRLQSRSQHTSLTHYELLDWSGHHHHQLHPALFATALDAVFDYCFHFSCRYDDSRRELSTLQRASQKLWRHFPAAAPPPVFDFPMTLQSVLSFMEEVVTPFLDQQQLEIIPETFFIHQGLGPCMVPHPQITYFVCSPDASTILRGSLGHPPIYAGPKLRAFIFCYFQRQQLSGLRPDYLMVWKELEYLRTGLQCLGQAINSYDGPEAEVKLSFFRRSVAHWIHLNQGEAAAQIFLEKFPETQASAEIENKVMCIADYFDEFNRSI
jgi:hypothetical protein